MDLYLILTLTQDKLGMDVSVQFYERGEEVVLYRGIPYDIDEVKVEDGTMHVYRDARLTDEEVIEVIESLMMYIEMNEI